MSELEIKGLHKAYETQSVLEDLDLTVEAGSFVSILGPSGSGKTTLLRVIAGFDRADQGTVRLHGDRRRRRVALRRIGPAAYWLRAPRRQSLPASLGPGQRGLRSRAQRPPRQTRRPAARNGGPCGFRPALPPRALRRTATARRARARSRDRAIARAARRTVLLARREPARHGAARRAPGAQGLRHDRHPRHARSRRSALARRSSRHH